MRWLTYAGGDCAKTETPYGCFAALQCEGQHISLSALDRRISTLFFFWDVFNVFLGAMFGGAIFSQLGNWLKDPGRLRQQMQLLHLRSMMLLLPGCELQAVLLRLWVSLLQKDSGKWGSLCTSFLVASRCSQCTGARMKHVPKGVASSQTGVLGLPSASAIHPCICCVLHLKSMTILLPRCELQAVLLHVQLDSWV